MSTPGATLSNPSTPSRRYTPAAGSAGYTSAASKRRRGKLLLLLGLLGLVVLLTVVIVPPSVVLTRKNKSNVAEGQQVVTTVVDGKTELTTLHGVVATRTRLTTLANGQASTVTSFVALPDVTVSATSIDQVQTAFVTTTLTDGLVVVARTATNVQTEVATVTFTAGGGQVGTRTLTLTSLDFVTVLGPTPTSSPASTTALPSSTSTTTAPHKYDNSQLSVGALITIDFCFPNKHDPARLSNHERILLYVDFKQLEHELVFLSLDYDAAGLPNNYDAPHHFHDAFDYFNEFFVERHEWCADHSAANFLV